MALNYRLAGVTWTVLSLLGGTTAGAQSETRLASVSTLGLPGNTGSGLPSISADGRYVAFFSLARTLVLGDTNQAMDVFVRDRARGRTTLSSLSGARRQGDSFSFLGALSASGRFLAFASLASNLVEGDTNGALDVFVRDRRWGTTRRVSVDSAGGQANGNSGIDLIYGEGRGLAISADGCVVAFYSEASNLVPGDTNDRGDVFVHDCETGAVSRVNVDTAGGQVSQFVDDVTLSADGRFVAFASGAPSLVAEDSNGVSDVFVRDRQLGTTSLVSVDSTGRQGDAGSRLGAISADGRFVAFVSAATNLVEGDANGLEDVFVHDRESGATRRVSVDGLGAAANGPSGAPSITAEGRFVAFESLASNLVPGDTNGTTDVFVHDLARGTTTCATSNRAGRPAGGFDPAIGADGGTFAVAFVSDATDLVRWDLNRATDVFVFEANADETAGATP